MTELQTIHQSILTVLAQHKEKSKNIWSQVQGGDILEQGGFKQLAQWSNQYGWEGTLNKAEAWALELEVAADEAVADHIRDVTTQPSGTTNEQLLHEARTSRAWERVRRVLDAQSELGVLGEARKRLAESTDPAERSVLLAELPDYLVARGGGDKDEIVRKLHDSLAASDSQFANLREYAHYAHGVRRTMVSNVRYVRNTITLLVQPHTAELMVNDPSSVHGVREAPAKAVVPRELPPVGSGIDGLVAQIGRIYGS